MSLDRMNIADSSFGPLLPYIRDPNVTDVNFNGYAVWVDDVTRGRYKANVNLTNENINTFINAIKNATSSYFNPQHNVLEGETDELRVEVAHESIAITGTAFSIRKTPPMQRITEKSCIESHYCTPEILTFLKNCILAHANGVVCGLTGVGKTELVKFLTNYIPSFERVITIEDNLELRYHELHPEKDCIELRVSDLFSYSKAIKTCMRLFPTWVFLSEARSIEVNSLLECFSTGHYGWTTMHTDDVRHIPERIKNMMQDAYAAEHKENEIYSFINVGILINRYTAADGRIMRYIDQIGVLHRDEVKNQNHIDLIANEGRLVSRKLPPVLMNKFRKVGISDPFASGRG